MISRTRMVMPTAAMLMFAICAGLSPNSCLITGISGATANHAKKQTKNASQLMWNARIAGVENEKSRIRLSFLPLRFMPIPSQMDFCGACPVPHVGLPRCQRDVPEASIQQCVWTVADRLRATRDDDPKAG